MRVFNHPNMAGGFTCPICGKSDDKPIVLISIEGTQKGNIIEARQYHLGCLELTTMRTSDGKTVIWQTYKTPTG